MGKVLSEVEAKSHFLLGNHFETTQLHPTFIHQHSLWSFKLSHLFVAWFVVCVIQWCLFILFVLFVLYACSGVSHFTFTVVYKRFDINITDLTASALIYSC